jgi:hypothetical protein
MDGTSAEPWFGRLTRFSHSILRKLETVVTIRDIAAEKEIRDYETKIKIKDKDR